MITNKLPNTAIEEMSPVVHNLSALPVFHCNLHELLEDRIVPVVPILELIEVWLYVFRHL